MLKPSIHIRAIFTRELISLLLLIALTMLVRMPNIAYPSLNRDEGIYLPVGQDMVRGYLPYARYWAIKPPLGFAFYALSTALFGNSVFALHLMGVVYIGIAAWVIYLAGKTFLQPAVSALASCAFIAAITDINDGDAILMEHIALLPMAWIVYQLCRNRPSTWQIGMAAGICTLIRPNLALLLPAGILCYWLDQLHDGVRLRPLLKPATQIAAAAAAPVLMVILIYWHAGLLGMLYTVNITFSELFFQINHLSEARNLNTYYLFCFRNDFAVICGLYTLWLFRRKADDADKKLRKLMVPGCAVFISILLTGDKYNHYNIQLLPFIVLPLAQLVWRFAGMAKQWQPWAWAGCCIAVALCILPLKNLEYLLEYLYAGTFPGWKSKDYAIADYLNYHKVEGQYVFSPEFPVINYLTGSLMPTAPTSPTDYIFDSRLKKLYGDQYTLDDLARDVFKKKPRFIVIYTKGIQFPQIMPYVHRYYTLQIGNPSYQIYEYDSNQQ